MKLKELTLRHVVGIVVGFAILNACNDALGKVKTNVLEKVKARPSVWLFLRWPVCVSYAVGIAIGVYDRDLALNMQVCSMIAFLLSIGMDFALDDHVEDVLGLKTSLFFLAGFWFTLAMCFALPQNWLARALYVFCYLAGCVISFASPLLVKRLLKPEYRQMAPRIPSAPGDLN